MGHFPNVLPMPLCSLEEKEEMIPDLSAMPLWITNLGLVGVL